MCIVWMDGMGEDIEVAHTAGTTVCKVLGAEILQPAGGDAELCTGQIKVHEIRELTTTMVHIKQAQYPQCETFHLPAVEVPDEQAAGLGVWCTQFEWRQTLNP